MAAPITRPTDADVDAFLAAVPNARRRADAIAVSALMREVTGVEPVLWGPSIVGFGSTPYTNTTGTYDWPVVGLSPRAASLTLYGLHNGYDPEPDPLLAELGPHTTSVACLYIKRLDTIDLKVLRALVAKAWTA